MYNIRIEENILSDLKNGLSTNDISLKYGIPAAVLCNLNVGNSLDKENGACCSVESSSNSKTAVFTVSSKNVVKATVEKKKRTPKSKVSENLSKREKQQKNIELRDLSRKINVLTKRGSLLEALETCDTPIGKENLNILIQKVKVLVLLGKEVPLEEKKDYLLEAFHICDVHCEEDERFQVQKDNITQFLIEQNLQSLIKDANNYNKQLIIK